MDDEELLQSACEYIGKHTDNSRRFMVLIQGANGDGVNVGGLYCCMGHGIELLADALNLVLHAALGEAEVESDHHFSPSSLTHH